MNGENSWVKLGCFETATHWAKWLGHMIVISEQSLNSSISLNKASRVFFKARLNASHSCLQNKDRQYLAVFFILKLNKYKCFVQFSDLR